MSALGGGRDGVDNQLLTATMDLSVAEKLNRKLKADNEKLERKCLEKTRQIQELEARRVQAEEKHAREMEDVMKNEQEAIATAQKACADLKQRNDENTKLRAELIKARGAADAAPPGVRYSMDEAGEKEREDDEEVEDEEVEDEENEEEEDEEGGEAEGGGKNGGGFFSWITGRTKKRRRGE